MSLTPNLSVAWKGTFKSFALTSESNINVCPIPLKNYLFHVFNSHFSIENFKRPQAEVDALLKLAQEKFERLIEEKDRLAEQGVRVNVIGNLSLLPTDLQLLVEKATSLTKKNQR